MMVREPKKANRITVMLDIELDKKIRALQAKMILTQTKSVSFSKILNIVLKKGLK